MFFLYSCLEIKTSFPGGDNVRGSAIGQLFVKEIRDNVTIDFEDFEVLYVSIKVVDKNTVIGTDYDECEYHDPILIPNRTYLPRPPRSFRFDGNFASCIAFT